MDDIKILMQAGKTEEEAKKYLDNGSIVFDNFEDFNEVMGGEYEKADFEKNNSPLVLNEDCARINYNDHDYYIMFVI